MPLLRGGVALAAEHHELALFAPGREHRHRLGLGESCEVVEVAVGTERELDITVARPHRRGRHDRDAPLSHHVHEPLPAFRELASMHGEWCSDSNVTVRPGPSSRGHARPRTSRSASCRSSTLPGPSGAARARAPSHFGAGASSADGCGSQSARCRAEGMLSPRRVHFPRDDLARRLRAADPPGGLPCGHSRARRSPEDHDAGLPIRGSAPALTIDPLVPIVSRRDSSRWRTHPPRRTHPRRGLHGNARHTDARREDRSPDPNLQPARGREPCPARSADQPDCRARGAGRKSELARSRVEAMITRLRAMEVGS